MFLLFSTSVEDSDSLQFNSVTINEFFFSHSFSISFLNFINLSISSSNNSLNTLSINCFSTFISTSSLSYFILSLNKSKFSTKNFSTSFLSIDSILFCYSDSILFCFIIFSKSLESNKRLSYKTDENLLKSTLLCRSLGDDLK
jgi:hypothetical protein